MPLQVQRPVRRPVRARKERGAPPARWRTGRPPGRETTLSRWLSHRLGRHRLERRTRTGPLHVQASRPMLPPVRVREILESTAAPASRSVKLGPQRCKRSKMTVGAKRWCRWRRRGAGPTASSRARPRRAIDMAHVPLPFSRCSNARGAPCPPSTSVTSAAGRSPTGAGGSSSARSASRGHPRSPSGLHLSGRGARRQKVVLRDRARRARCGARRGYRRQRRPGRP